MADRIRWGVLGTGNIAGQFVDGVAGAMESRIVAIGSRSATRAAAFAGEHQLHDALTGDYADVIGCDQVDAIYIALPNHLHATWTLRALAAGRHVLCEKPLAMDADEARAMFDAARKAGLLLAEAFMYQSHPLTHRVIQAVRDGAIGELRAVRLSFCFRTRKIEGNVRFVPAMGGGALMDLGCYCLSFMRLAFDAEPDRVTAEARMHPTGVDEATSAVLAFPGGRLGSFTCAMTVQGDNTALLCGDEGYLAVPVPWKPPVRDALAMICRNTPPRMDGAPAGGPPPREEIRVHADRPLYALEADDFARAIQAGGPATVSEAHSLGNARLIDAIRQQIGLIW